MTYKKIFSVGLLFIVFLVDANAQSSRFNYLEVRARQGDGALSILRAFGIKSDCNLEQFYVINRLNKRKGLYANRKYKLPIRVYQYNSKSIRSTIGINDWDRAVGIQKYNELMLSSGMKESDYRKDNVLWVPDHFFKCPNENPEYVPYAGKVEVPDTPVKDYPLRGVYDIFGKEYSQVPLISNKLKGCVYYVVSGHGGPDPGAIGQFEGKNLCEDEYAYDISLRLAHKLLSHGAVVYLITRDPDDGIRSGEYLPCDKDELCWGGEKMPVSQRPRLQQRADAVNSLFKKNQSQGVTFQRVIVIHVDSDSKSKSTDMYFYHQIESERSKNMAQILRRTIKAKYNEYRKGRGYNGTVSGRDLFMLREVEAHTVFIELGNIRNRNDQARLVIEGNRQLIANWLSEGFLNEKVSP